MHVLCTPLATRWTLTVSPLPHVDCTYPPLAAEAKSAPLQPASPAGRKTRRLPAEAKEPITWMVVRVSGGMTDGLKTMSGGAGGGDEGGEGGGGEAGGGKGEGASGGGADGGEVAQMVKPPAVVL